MSATYTIRGQKFQRQYTSDRATPSYGSPAEASNIAATLCELPWVQVANVTPCFPVHAGNPETEGGNVTARHYFDAALFCSDHDSDAGTHMTYANGTCYRFVLPDLLPGEQARVLQTLTVAVNCDPYNPSGVRISVSTNNTGIIPILCSECRNGYLSSNTDQSAQTHTVGTVTWASTNTHVEGAAPREIRDGKWYAGYGNAVISPTGGLTLGKYLYVFVLLENYNYSRNGFLESSAYAQPKMTITLASATAALESGVCNDLMKDGAYLISKGRQFTRVPGTWVVAKDKFSFIETPATDLCMPELKSITMSYDGSNERGMFLATQNDPEVVRQSVLSGTYSMTFLPRQVLASQETGTVPRTKGPPQSVYDWPTDNAKYQARVIAGDDVINTPWSVGHMATFVLPPFNANVTYYEEGDLPDRHQVGFWFAGGRSNMKYSVTSYELPPATLVPMKLTVDGTETASEGAQVDIEFPYSDKLNPHRVSVGTYVSAIGCTLHPKTPTDMSDVAPGVDLFFISHKNGAVTDHDGFLTSETEWVKGVSVYGKDVIKATEAYSMLDDGTATNVFLGDYAGSDSNALSVAVESDSAGADYLKRNVFRANGIFYKDAVANAYFTNDKIITRPSDQVNPTIGSSQLREWFSVGGQGWRKVTLHQFDEYGVAETYRCNPDEKAIIEAYLGKTLDEYFDGPSTNYNVETYIGRENDANAYPVWLSYKRMDSAVTAYDDSKTYPLFVTNGSVTKLLCYVRVVTRTCYDIVRYPDSTVLNQDKIDITKCNIAYTGGTTLNDNFEYQSRGEFYSGVPMLFTMTYKGTFVQLWAPDETTAAKDFGPADVIVHTKTTSPKNPGPFFNFDLGTGTATPDQYDFSSMQRFAKTTVSSGATSVVISGSPDPVTVAVTGSVDKLVPYPADDSKLFVFGSFTAVGGLSCANVASLDLSSNTPVASAVPWAASAAMTYIYANDHDMSVFPSKLCSASSSQFSSMTGDLLLTGKFSAIGSVDKTGRTMKISVTGDSVVSNIQDGFTNVGNQTPVTALFGSSLSADTLFLSNGTAGGYYTALVYDDMTCVQDATGADALVGMGACYSKFYESGLSGSGESELPKSVGSAFDVTFDNKTFKVLQSDGAGNYVQGTEVHPVWTLAFSLACVPFSAPSGFGATKVVVDWSGVSVEEYGTTSSSDRSVPVSDHAVVHVWMNYKARVGTVDTFDPAFFDLSKPEIGDWKYVGTISDIINKSSAEFSIDTFPNRVGTLMFVGWLPPETIHAADAQVGLHLGIGSVERQGSNGFVVKSGWAPDVYLA